jgi:aldose 1-epimerase
MVTERSFGRFETGEAALFTLRNRNGCEASVTNYGATLTRLVVPDRWGRFSDVVLGYGDVAGYVAGRAYLGATVGRVANRIAKGKFELNGRSYQVAANDAPHNLHGGPLGWDRLLWKRVASRASNELCLALHSKDGDAAFPGAVEAQTTYTLTDDNQLRVSMTAQSDALTLVNMAHHSYWNLGGHDAGNVLGHVLTLEADAYTPGAPVVPDGRVLPVKYTPFDFTRPKSVGEHIAQVGPNPDGYDHNFVVRGNPGALRRVAALLDPGSGRSMLVSANQPGVQFYSGNFLDASMRGKGGVSYPRRSALCLETQAFPNAVNVPAWRNQVLLAPGRVYHHEMVHAFGVL